ncbi:MAG: FAD:protein FMN transferase, partial [Bacillota bacterium]
EDTFLVIKKALEYAESSEGKYDPTIGTLVKLWGIGTEEARVPSDSEIESAKDKVDYNLVELNESKNTVKINKKGMSLDLGGIAKGYAADEVHRIVSDHYQNPSAFVNLGGNVLVVGRKPGDELWNIGIQDPRENRGNVMASIKTADKTIVTSGNYERYFEKNGEIYHHILDPDTGKPVRNNLISVSIITDNSLRGDALSTSLYILGLEQGLEYVENIDNTEAMFITDDNKVILSSGLNDKVKILNSDFEIVER